METAKSNDSFREYVQVQESIFHWWSQSFFFQTSIKASCCWGEMCMLCVLLTSILYGILYYGRKREKVRKKENKQVCVSVGFDYGYEFYIDGRHTNKYKWSTGEGCCVFTSCWIAPQKRADAASGREQQGRMEVITQGHLGPAPILHRWRWEPGMIWHKERS